MSSGSDPATVQRLFLQNAAPLRGFILGLLADRGSADDVFQEVFVTATQRAADFRPEASFLAWARGIARNKVLEHYRRSRSGPCLFSGDLLEALAVAAEERDDGWQERRAALAGCIRELAPRARQILELRYAEQPLAPPMIAERLAWTVNAVHVALARARKFLQECAERSLARQGGVT